MSDKKKEEYINFYSMLVVIMFVVFIFFVGVRYGEHKVIGLLMENGVLELKVK